MRASIKIDESIIIKSYDIDSKIQKYFEKHLDAYLLWVNLMGFKIPNTELKINENKLEIIQGIIPKTQITDYYLIFNHLMLLNDYENNYGFDSNPTNFIQNQSGIYFVDFYPFLINDKNLLKMQFQYDFKEIYSRYFKKINIITTFLIRLCLISTIIFKDILSLNVTYFLNNFNEILPREKTRLLACIDHCFNQKVIDLGFVYKQSKTINCISKTENLRLYKILQDLGASNVSCILKVK